MARKSRQITNRIQRKLLGIIFLTVFLSIVLMAEDQDKSLTLPLGPPALRGKYLEVVAGQLYSARSGKVVTFEQMVKDLKKVRLVYAGETHDNQEMHDWQVRIIKSLYNQDPNLGIGLEQVTVDLQPILDSWAAGKLSQEEFLRQINWYLTWNFNFGYYQKIFNLAKEKKIPVFALNVPRDLITKIRKQGYQAMSEEEKKLIPPLDLNYEEHRLLIRTVFESEEIPPQMKGNSLEAMFESLYRAQVAWDETMGLNVIRAAETTGCRMVVLAGSGHLIYNLGLNLRASRLSRLPSATVIGVVVPENSKLKVSRGLADYIYGVKKKDYPDYPAPGLSLKKVEGLSNLVVNADPKEPLTKEARFKKGDVILSVADKHFDDPNELKIFLAGFNWGDEVEFQVLRNGEVVTINLAFEPELVVKKEKMSEN
ncbi:MAG: ChaN family lipoprotein [Acidobacteriota bacterium]|nr:ChaN family lipoprotein [Acidobacteriota bacterium]MDW3228544.1 ChaN family lipoprotein [Acidobacteriota bacterium]MDY0231502.1 ChaN family lipoprotein [Candidatus Saccharicenans sp.]